MINRALGHATSSCHGADGLFGRSRTLSTPVCAARAPKLPRGRRRERGDQRGANVRSVRRGRAARKMKCLRRVLLAEIEATHRYVSAVRYLRSGRSGNPEL